MHVVLDANTIISEGFGDSARFRLFLTTRSAAGYTICVPASVIEEVVGGFRRVIERELTRVEDGLGILSRRLAKPLLSPITSVDIESEASYFRDRLESQLKEHASTILEYPSTLHHELVKRAVARIKPFDEKGSGYRDALIWESVLDLLDKVNGQVVLISSDRDFGDKGTLDPDLADELSDRGQDEGKVILVSSLLGFIDIHVRPKLKLVFADKPIQVLDHLGVSKESIVEPLLDASFYQTWLPEQLGLPLKYKPLRLIGVEHIADLEIGESREVSLDKFLVKSAANIAGNFIGLMQVSDVNKMDDLAILNLDWGGHYALVAVELALTWKLDLVVDISKLEEPRIEVLSMEPALSSTTTDSG